MIRKHYSGSARRALNIIWNAAGRYDFEPPFMAFYPNGQPDSYFNLVIGLTAKYFDMERVEEFFDSCSNAVRGEEFAEFLWLGIENCVYEKEIIDRPIMEKLRRERAEEFFRVMPTLSRQQMMYSSMPVLTQQQARWASVLGQRGPVMSAREKRMQQALLFPGSPEEGFGGGKKMPVDSEILRRRGLTASAWLEVAPEPAPAELPNAAGREKETDRLLACMSDFLQTFFRYDAQHPDKKTGGPSFVRTIAGRVLRHQQSRRDVLFLKTGTGKGDRDRSVSLEHFGQAQRVKQPDEEDLAYIKACFGDMMVSENKVRLLENELCCAEDAGCRLWITQTARPSGSGGKASQPSAGLPWSGNEEGTAGISAEGRLPQGSSAGNSRSRMEKATADSFPRTAEELAEKRRIQAQRNRAYLQANARLVSGQIRHLSGRLNTIFESLLRFLPVKASSGSLIAREAWRMKITGSSDVFEKSGDEAQKDIALTLLLDASMSRVNTQEIIAAEAYVIARSLQEAGIPVQVCTYRSLRGYTVIEVLKAFQDRSCEGILNFYAGGWNRDGLALRTMSALIREARDKDGFRPLLFVLTDGSPNDSAPLAPVSEADAVKRNILRGNGGGRKMDSGAGQRERGIRRILPQEYQGAPAVKHTADAVADLRRAGIRTGAIFHGATYHLESIHQIYGQEYVRIMKLDQLSDAVTDLLIREMQKVKA